MDIYNSLIVELPEDIKKTIYFGDYDKALKLIDIYMDRNIPNILRNRLEYEKDRIRRLKDDYIYSFDEAFELASSKIEGFAKEELEKMKDERYAEWVYIDGEVKFIDSFLNNIIKVNKNFKKRLIDKNTDNKDSQLVEKTIDEIISSREKKYFIHLRTGIKLKERKARVGESVKVHIPIPQNAQQIKNIKIHNTSHNPKFIAPENHPQRTIYFEEEVNGGDIFTVEYSYENHIKYNDLKPEIVSKNQPSFYTEEWIPHIRFTPFLVELTNEIIKDEKNPLIKARKIYDYITKNVQYSYMPQYATITNIPEYCAYNLKGDCGVQAILFITLCRIANIPARWQSGLYSSPYYIGCHDWTEFYIEPYGWIFADPSHGGGALRNGNEKKWNFFFGNLDPFRMVANSEVNYDFIPAKKHYRQDPFDNQIGEIEYEDRFLYDDEYEAILEIINIHEI
ncbi:transglutaminase-like domain-containing protein [Anaerosalibacter massiliensis]|uniref:Transglutaminase-like domain-containing protein n=1 Tax=Anaerosalibacter massiliensis TaxID=1347392 RepID=A0A9X2MJ77_9FIRM|nr:transglutaminase-like domain-containing protein [Anaerosalibacter massiliensis]MCR2045048.1 transglutaminase-like domain-containing protein [Anaerosalibacter massiliensis]